MIGSLGDAGFLWKFGMCLVPLAAGCLAAQKIAVRRGMARGRSLWRHLGRLAMIGALACLVGGLLARLMG